MGSDVDEDQALDPRLLRQHRGRCPGQRAAPVHEDALAQGMAHTRFPTLREGAVLAQDLLRDRLCQRRPVDAELVFLADGLIPAAWSKW